MYRFFQLKLCLKVVVLLILCYPIMWWASQGISTFFFRIPSKAVLSPDGQKLLLTKTCFDYNVHLGLFLVDVASGAKRKIFRANFWELRDPTFYRDSDHMIITRSKVIGISEEEVRSRCDIMEIDVKSLKEKGIWTFEENIYPSAIKYSPFSGKLALLESRRIKKGIEEDTGDQESSPNDKGSTSSFKWDREYNFVMIDPIKKSRKVVLEGHRLRSSDFDWVAKDQLVFLFDGDLWLYDCSEDRKEKLIVGKELWKIALSTDRSRIFLWGGRRTCRRTKIGTLASKDYELIKTSEGEDSEEDIRYNLVKIPRELPHRAGYDAVFMPDGKTAFYGNWSRKHRHKGVLLKYGIEDGDIEIVRDGFPHIPKLMGLSFDSDIIFSTGRTRSYKIWKVSQDGQKVRRLL